MNIFSNKLLNSSYKQERFLILIILSFTLVGCDDACSKYKHSQFIEGMYYPNGTINLQVRPVKSIDRIFVITVSHPFRVSELGVITPGWFDEPGSQGVRSQFDVGRAEVFKKKIYYISLYQLYNTGRFEYFERSISLKEWIRIHPIWTVFISVILLIVIIYLVKKYLNKQTQLFILYSTIGVAIVLVIVYWDDIIKFIDKLVLLLILVFIGSAFDKTSSSDNNSNDTFETDKYEQEREHSRASSKSRCKDCRSIDMAPLLISKGDGRCKDCDGTGHDRTAEALVDFGTLGLVDGKIDCKTCYGTGQCQSCGGTGFIFN